MGFCTGDCACGRSCASSDDFCQQHNCREEDCEAKRKPAPKTGVNVNNPFRYVDHASLKRVTEESPFRSWCPVCDKGILLVRRLDTGTLGLSKLDNCTLCGQRFIYNEDEIAGEKLAHPWPTTLDEAVEALDRMLVDEDRDFMLKSQEPVENIIADLHHSLGRHLRNTWGLWHESPLAKHIKETRGVEHPDDMSHVIIEYFCNRKKRTAWERLKDGDPV